MEKHVKYCPYCKKYQPSTFYDCAFCLRKLWLLKDWEETEDEEKEDWLKYPMPAKDISGMDSDLVKKNQNEATAYDTKIKAEIQEKLDKERRKAEEEAAKPVYTPKCPTCGSPDLEKIGTASKVLDVAFWGFASGKVKKTFHCNNCGYEW
jgi:hypothetical protein|nr:MAG TPA: RNA polymerase-like protein [Bacteriophage sp.]